MVRYHVFTTALGWMGVAARGGRIVRVILPVRGRAGVVNRIRRECPGAARGGTRVLDRAARQLAAYADGARVPFDLPLDLEDMTDFRRRVLEACAAIPFGECRTYGQLANVAGSPAAARAVGQVMRQNPLPIVVPCHRVIGADGRMVGFSAPGGLRLKERLLAHEGLPMRDGKVVFG